MSKERPFIKPVRPPRPSGFEDFTWSVNIGLLILAGMAATLIIAKGGFGDPHPLHNAWVRLASLTLSTALLLWAALVWDQKFRRRLQFACLVSGLVHMGMAVCLTGDLLPGL